MKYIVNRVSILEEVLEVEAEIKQISGNRTYRKIVRNLKRLNRMGFGDRVMTISSPDDLTKKVRVRKHSKEMKAMKRRYEERQLEYEKRIDALLKRRVDLENQLFN